MDKRKIISWLNFSSKKYKTQIKKALYKGDSQPVVCNEESAMR
jgi:hypothetical protein